MFYQDKYRPCLYNPEAKTCLFLTGQSGQGVGSLEEAKGKAEHLFARENLIEELLQVPGLHEQCYSCGVVNQKSKPVVIFYHQGHYWCVDCGKREQVRLQVQASMFLESIRKAEEKTDGGDLGDGGGASGVAPIDGGRAGGLLSDGRGEAGRMRSKKTGAKGNKERNP
jgi:hypothetical protein